MYALISTPLVRRTLATLRSAEFGFFGVVVKTRVQTPLRWGAPFRAGVFVLVGLVARPLRTSCSIVGTRSTPVLLLYGAGRRLLMGAWPGPRRRSPEKGERKMVHARVGPHNRPHPCVFRLQGAESYMLVAKTSDRGDPHYRTAERHAHR